MHETFTINQPTCSRCGTPVHQGVSCAEMQQRLGIMQHANDRHRDRRFRQSGLPLPGSAVTENHCADSPARHLPDGRIVANRRYGSLAEFRAAVLPRQTLEFD